MCEGGAEMGGDDGDGDGGDDEHDDDVYVRKTWLIACVRAWLGRAVVPKTGGAGSGLTSG